MHKIEEIKKALSNIEDIKEDGIVFIGYKIDKQKIREFLILNKYFKK